MSNHTASRTATVVLVALVLLASVAGWTLYTPPAAAAAFVAPPGLAIADAGDTMPIPTATPPGEPPTCEDGGNTC
jgi:hypothetical protein